MTSLREKSAGLFVEYNLDPDTVETVMHGRLQQARRNWLKSVRESTKRQEQRSLPVDEPLQGEQELLTASAGESHQCTDATSSETRSTIMQLRSVLQSTDD